MKSTTPGPSDLVRLINHDGTFIGRMAFHLAQHRASVMELKMIPVGKDKNGIQIFKMVLGDDDSVGGRVLKPKRPKKPAGKACAVMK